MRHDILNDGDSANSEDQVRRLDIRTPLVELELTDNDEAEGQEGERDCTARSVEPFFVLIIMLIPDVEFKQLHTLNSANVSSI